MISEIATVVKVHNQQITLQTVRSSACQSCKAKSACGQGILSSVGDEHKQEQKNYLTIHSPLPVQVNEQVELLIPEDVLVKSALLVYLMPLLAMFVSSLVASLFTEQQAWIAFWAFLAFVLSLVLLKKIDQKVTQREDFSIQIKKLQIAHQFHP